LPAAAFQAEPVPLATEVLHPSMGGAQCIDDIFVLP